MRTALCALAFCAFAHTAQAADVVRFDYPPFGDDPHTLLSIDTFDPTRFGVMVVYLHGHGGSLGDIARRQRIPRQVVACGCNAVLAAPRLFDRRAGRFSEKDFFTAYMDEVAERMSALAGGTVASDVFKTMPIVLVFYSGGYLPAREILENGGAAVDRIRGIVSFDGMYGAPDAFVQWIAREQQKDAPGFFLSVNAHTDTGNARLAQALKEAGISFGTALPPRTKGVAIVDAGPDVTHADIMARAWTHNPLADILQRM